MSAFDRIIGYEVIRKELERTADALKNPTYSVPCSTAVQYI